MSRIEETVYGIPCMVDMTSGDLERVKLFYSAIFGWEFTDTGRDFGHYNVITRNGEIVGGATQHSYEFMGPEPINAWSMYFATPNTKSSLKSAEENGGEIILPPMQIGDRGTMGMAVDPGGADFGFWQPDQLKGFDRWCEHGFPRWFELYTRDFDATVTFYAALLGAELRAAPLEDGQRYVTLMVNDTPSAGIWDIEGVLPEEVPARWNICLAVDDDDAALTIAKENGGTVLMDPEDIQYGRMSTIQDPAGAVFSIISG